MSLFPDDDLRLRLRQPPGNRVFAVAGHLFINFIKAVAFFIGPEMRFYEGVNTFSNRY